ncbi:hypothetical protein [Nocardia fluminea]|uniref:hypothetical protein n=1 Tax=Nocardia fluminea TaxID=134984 RepID=UPI0033C2C2C3
MGGSEIFLSAVDISAGETFDRVAGDALGRRANQHRCGWWVTALPLAGGLCALVADRLEGRAESHAVADLVGIEHPEGALGEQPIRIDTEQSELIAGGQGPLEVPIGSVTGRVTLVR